MDAISYSYADKQAKRITKFNANPDSNSGIVTVPKVIEAGESVTIPAGRVAVLPNIQVDGEIVVEGDGEIFIPAGVTLSKVVELEGDQTISNVKTFLESPIVPTATEGNQAVNLETANSYDLGVDQTWQDVTASRSAGVTYTNNTGKPIVVSIIWTGVFNNTNFSFVVDGRKIADVSFNAGTNSSQSRSITVIVPNGSTYSAPYVGTGWYELR